MVWLCQKRSCKEENVWNLAKKYTLNLFKDTTFSPTIPGEDVFAGVWIGNGAKLGDDNSVFGHGPDICICLYEPEHKRCENNQSGSYFLPTHISSALKAISKLPKHMKRMFFCRDIPLVIIAVSGCLFSESFLIRNRFIDQGCGTNKEFVFSFER